MAISSRRIAGQKVIARQVDDVLIPKEVEAHAEPAPEPVWHSRPESGAGDALACVG